MRHGLYPARGLLILVASLLGAGAFALIDPIAPPQSATASGSCYQFVGDIPSATRDYYAAAGPLNTPFTTQVDIIFNIGTVPTPSGNGSYYAFGDVPGNTLTYWDGRKLFQNAITSAHYGGYAEGGRAGLGKICGALTAIGAGHRRSDGGCVGASDHGPDRAQVSAYGQAVHQRWFAFSG